MADETRDARMERLLRTLPPALRGMGFGDPDDAEYAHASDVVAWAIKEIARLREERRSITTLLGKVETLEADNAKLREERLSNEERGAIRWATAALLYDADKTWPAFRERSKHSREAAETMKRLLDRHPLPPGPEANG